LLTFGFAGAMLGPKETYIHNWRQFMLIEIRFRERVGSVHLVAKKPIHGLKVGPETLTPQNVGFKLQALSLRDASSGLPSGKRQHSPLSITKETDSASPNLFQHCISSREGFPEIVVSIWNTNGQGKSETIAHTITLTNATITGYTRYTPQLGLNGNPGHSGHATSTSTHELETIQLTFQAIKITNVMNSKSAKDDWMGG
jgi:type VI secretion system secreted protein Hcp